MHWLILLLPLAVIAGVLIALARLSGEIHVRRSQVIAAEPQTTFDTIRDLRSWPAWSPWLLHEPEAKLDYSADPTAEGGWYSWDGRLIGAGRIEHRRILAPADSPDGSGRIEQRLVFRRPFKTEAAASWDIEPTAEGCEVTWSMRGQMPFLLRFLAPLMAQVIDKDYQLGLVRLRAQVDETADRFDLRFVGDTEEPARRALTIPYKGDVETMVEAMERGFPRLAQVAARRGIEPAGPVFTAYHETDPKRGRFECDLALPLPEDAPDDVAAELDDIQIKRLGGGRFYEVEVQGSYDYLELAWYSIMSHLRMVKRRRDSKRAALEVYAVDPTTAGRNDLLTRIFVPLK